MREERAVAMSEQPGYRYDVFISYSRADCAWVWQELLPRLEAGGLTVCIDERDFAIGAPRLSNIEQAIDGSRHTLIVLSPEWAASEWADFESLLAGSGDPAGRRQRLIPALLKSCTLPRRIDALTYADFTQPAAYEDQFRRLLRQLLHNRSLPVRPPAPGPSPFVVGPPIAHPRAFFGRERELKRLFNLLKRSPLQNAAIIGPRRSGKTSLLQYLQTITTTPRDQVRPDQRADWLPQPERYRWIFVDFQDPRLGSQEGLLRHLLASLELPVPDPCDLEHFLDSVARTCVPPR